MSIAAEIFRAYDIRGIVGSTLRYKDAVAIGKVLGTLILEQGETACVIGKDGRLSSNMLAENLSLGLATAGCNVIGIGQVPTPVLYFASHHLNCASAVMVTGSHNPKDYNGFKIVLSGNAIFGDRIYEIYQRIQKKAWRTGAGTVSFQQDILLAYTQAITERINLSRPMHIVVDCGNGAAGLIAPQIYRALGCKVTELFCTVDGNFPNHHPDPGDPKNLSDIISTVTSEGAEIGLAFDGDGDRLGIVDSNGKIIWPDRYLMLLLADILARHPGKAIVYDIKSSATLAEVITKYGGKPVMWKTGHSLIKAKMKELDAPLGSEMSGHIFFKDRWYGFDDAIYAGARLLECLGQETCASGSVFNRLPETHATPEIAIEVKSEQEKFAIINLLKAKASFAGAKEILTLDGLRVEFPDGWGLIRPSNTSPKLVARFEGVTLAALTKIQTLFKVQLNTLVPELVLPF